MTERSISSVTVQKDSPDGTVSSKMTVNHYSSFVNKTRRKNLFVCKSRFHSFLSQIAAQKKRPNKLVRTEDSARKTILTRTGYSITTACVQPDTPVQSVKPKNKVNRSDFDSSSNHRI